MIERRQFIKQMAAGAAVLAMPYLWLPRKSAMAQVAPNVAFIGAQGHGAGANGWRSPAARILFVTNRNSSGAGSLQAALTASGPRYIIFQVGGRWTFSTTPASDESGSGNYYLAGQTAPGDGVSLTTGASALGGDAMIYRIAQSHVCCRFIRIRGSVGAGEIIGLGVGTGATPARTDVIVDHCSISWIWDDNISTANLDRATIQWCISSESLSNCGVGCGGRGFLIADQAGMSNLSLHHNYFAHNVQRSPDCGGVTGFELINHLTYNCGAGQFGINVALSDQWGLMTANIRGCYFKWGPSTTFGGLGETHADTYEIYDTDQAPPNGGTLYVNDCLMNGPTLGTVAARRKGELGTAGTPFNFNPAVPITVHAASAVPGLINQMGATKPKRDAIDQSVIDSYAAYTRPPSLTTTSSNIVSETDTLLGGFPAYNDANNDTATNLSPSGMTDEFITRMGLANTVASALSTSISTARGLGEPYQNIEWNLMEKAGDIAPLQRSGSAPSPARLLPPGNLRQ
jgi:hypothetical protein